MKRLRQLAVATLLFSTCLHLSPAVAGFGDFLEQMKKAVGVEGGVSESEVVDGLRQALEIGTDKAVEKVSALNGYFENPKIRIPLPESVRKVKRLLEVAGYGPQVEAFELSMNRAAEEAAPRAKALFMESLKKMTFTDARKILDGDDDAATRYFEGNTRKRLFAGFEPVVRSTMSRVGVTRAYQDLDARVRDIPFAGSMSFDLDQYVTNQALDGLFLMLAEEEKKIRRDPAARVTDLLKQVFGGE
ncbi:MAG TPA: DUF4197 domain-containing protein [Deltaproteobacteria bacterium]|nr:DUF4197 domain-containing protein [Deltaproteobacteria bacterium]